MKDIKHKWDSSSNGNYFVQHLRQGCGYSLPEGEYFIQFIRNSTFFTADSMGPFEGCVFRFYLPKGE